MRYIVSMYFGSTLYGTKTPSSDVDYKHVYVPDGRSILLQKTIPTINKSRSKSEGERNTTGDIDDETFSFQRYLSLLSQGQTAALDMFFAPQSMLIGEVDPVWYEIRRNGHRLLSKQMESFVGYCRAQSIKYGIKGTRVRAVQVIVDALQSAIERYGHLGKLTDALGDIQQIIDQEQLQFTAITDIVQPNRALPVRHLECCNRKAAEFVSLKDVHAIFARVLDTYGARSRLAEGADGADWKALSHAVRVASEAVELLSTGTITLPLPNAAYVRSVKLGEVSYAAVTDDLTKMLLEVEEQYNRTSLRDTPDFDYIDDLVERVHRQKVLDC